MHYINPIYIENFIQGLNDSGINYVMIKNIGDELPNHLLPSKDIDIIVHKDSIDAFHRYMKPIARKILHPYSREYGWRNIYGLDDFEEWRLNIADDLLIDVTTKLCCKSIMPKMWLPVDNLIQKDIWKNRVFDKDKNWWRMDDNVLFAYLPIRCVFDKHEFSELYIAEIERLRPSIDLEVVMSYLRLVFFNFAAPLVDMMDKKDYQNIIPSYLKFRKY